MTPKEADLLTEAIEQHTQRMADLGTRLRALADADVATIEAELADVQAMDVSPETWGTYAQAGAMARDHFLDRGHQLLRTAK